VNKRLTPQVAETSGLEIAFGILAVLLIAAVFARIQLPMIENDRIAFYALATLGLGMCTIGGIGRTVQERGWLNPITILGTVLGILALALVLMVLASGYIPLIPDERAAFIALTGIVLVKAAVGVLTNVKPH